MRLITDFDDVFRSGPEWPAPPEPTDESLAHISGVLGLPGLPSLFVQLAREAHYFGLWFGSLGPDYDGNRHTLGLNAYWREKGLPSSLFLMTYGFDAVCDCLDVDSSDDPDSMRVVQLQVGCGAIDSYHEFAPTFEKYLGKIVEIFAETEGAGSRNSADT